FLMRVVEGTARLGQGAEVHQVHAVARGADLAVDLVAALQLGLVEGPERALEAEAAAARVLGAAGRERGLGGEGEAGRDGDQDQGLFHRTHRSLEGHGRSQPFFSGEAGAASVMASPPGRTGSEMVAGIGRGVSRRPTTGMSTRKNRK